MKFYLVILLFLLLSCSINERSIKAPIKEKSLNVLKKIKKDPTTKNADFIEYIVKNNDTIYSISLTYNINYKKFYQSTNLNDFNLIYPGQVLLIPKNNQIIKKNQKDFAEKKFQSNGLPQSKARFFMLMIQLKM